MYRTSPSRLITNLTRSPNFIFTLFKVPTSLTQTSINVVFVFWKKIQEVSIASWNAHFPYTKPLIKIVSDSDYFKIKPSRGSDWGSEPLILLIQNRTIKHFVNISRKICSSIAFYTDVTFLQYKINLCQKIILLHTYTGGCSVAEILFFTRRVCEPGEK